MKRIPTAFRIGLAFALVGASIPCRASAEAPRKPVAMIVDASGALSWDSHRKGSPELLDDLYQGEKLKVAPDASISIVYFDGCLKETVRGENALRVGRKSGEVRDRKGLSSKKTVCEPSGPLSAQETGSAPLALSMRGSADGPAPGEAPSREEQLAAAVQRNPEDAEARLGCAIYLERRARFDEAMAEWERLSRLRGGDPLIRSRQRTIKTAAALMSLERWLRDRLRGPGAAAGYAGGNSWSGVLSEAGFDEPALVKALAPAMARRLEVGPSLARLKESGTLVEGPDGLVGGRDDAPGLDQAAQALASAENDGRRSILQIFSDPGPWEKSPAAPIKAEKLRELYADAILALVSEDGH